MFIHGINVEGFAGLPSFRKEGLGRIVRVGGTARARTALADALTLALCPFSNDDLEAASKSLGWGATEVEGTDRPEAVVVSHPHAVLRLLEPNRPPRARIELDLSLDPPQLEILRQAAIKEPGLGPALLKNASLNLSVGWLFTNDGMVGTPSLNGARIGEVIARTGERPAWLKALLAKLPGRWHRRRPGTLDVDAIASADRSADPVVRTRLAHMRRDLSGPPFRLPRLEIVESAGEFDLAFGEELVPLRAMGPAVRDAVGLAASVHLHPSEILLTEHPNALLPRRGGRRWLHSQAEAQASPLEQIWCFGTGPGTLDIEVG